MPDGAFDDASVFVAAAPPDEDGVRTLLVRAGPRVFAPLRLFDEDDHRRREFDGVLESLEFDRGPPPKTTCRR